MVRNPLVVGSRPGAAQYGLFPSTVRGRSQLSGRGVHDSRLRRAVCCGAFTFHSNAGVFAVKGDINVSNAFSSMGVPRRPLVVLWDFAH